MNLVIPAVAVWFRHGSLEKFAENKVKVKVKLPLHTCSLPLLPIYTTLYTSEPTGLTQSIRSSKLTA